VRKRRKSFAIIPSGSRALGGTIAWIRGPRTGKCRVCRTRRKGLSDLKIIPACFVRAAAPAARLLRRWRINHPLEELSVIDCTTLQFEECRPTKISPLQIREGDVSWEGHPALARQTARESSAACSRAPSVGGDGIDAAGSIVLAVAAFVGKHLAMTTQVKKRAAADHSARRNRNVCHRSS